MLSTERMLALPGQSPATVEENDETPCTQPVQESALKGVVAYVEVRCRAENRSRGVAKQLELLGATVAKKFGPDVTHVIWKDGKKLTKDKARKKGIHLLSVLWVESCKENQAHVAESLYPVDDSEDDCPIPIGRLKRYKSMQPKELEEELRNSEEKIRRRNRRNELKSPGFMSGGLLVTDTPYFSPSSKYLDRVYSSPSQIPDTPATMRACLDRLKDIRKNASPALERNPILGASPSEAVLSPLERRQVFGQLFSTDSVNDDANSEPISSRDVSKPGPTNKENNNPQRFGRAKKLQVAFEEEIKNKIPDEGTGSKTSDLGIFVQPQENKISVEVEKKQLRRSRRSHVINLKADQELLTFRSERRKSVPCRNVGKEIVSKTNKSSSGSSGGGEDICSKNKGCLLPEIAEKLEELKSNAEKSDKSDLKDRSVKTKGNTNRLSKQSSKKKKTVRDQLDEDDEIIEITEIDKPLKDDARSNDQVMLEDEQEKVCQGRGVRRISRGKQSLGNVPPTKMKETRQTDVIQSHEEQLRELQGDSKSHQGKDVITSNVRRDSLELNCQARGIFNGRAQNNDSFLTGDVVGASKTENVMEIESDVGSALQKLPRELKMLEKIIKNPFITSSEDADGDIKVKRVSGERSEERRNDVPEVDLVSCFKEGASNQSNDTPTRTPKRKRHPTAPKDDDKKASKKRRLLNLKKVADTPTLLVEPKLSSPSSQTKHLKGILDDTVESDSKKRIKKITLSGEGEGPTDVALSQGASTSLEVITPSRRSLEDFKTKRRTSCRQKVEMTDSGVETSAVSSASDSDDRSLCSNQSDKKKKKAIIPQADSQGKISKPNIVLTSMHASEQGMMMSIIKSLGCFKISDCVNVRTTHVVTGDSRRTLNVLGAISHGCWLLSKEWVLNSLENGSWLTEEPFEVHNYFPAAKLSRQLKLQAMDCDGPLSHLDLFSEHGPFFVADSSSPPHEKLTELIRVCGGTISKSIQQSALFIGTPNRHVGIPSVKEKWVLDCISEMKSLPVEDYLHPA